MIEYFRKYELILDGIAVTLTVDVDNQLTLVELNEVEKIVGTDTTNVNVSKNGVTTSLDYEELDEVISLLQIASETLKRAERRDVL